MTTDQLLLEMIDDPNGLAIVDPFGEWSWGAVADTVNRCATAIGRMVEPGGRIAVFAENSAEVALAHFGGLFAGVSSVPTNFHLTADEAAYIFQDSESSVLFAGPQTLERAVHAAETSGITTVVAWRCEPEQLAEYPTVRGWDEWLEAEDGAPSPVTRVPLPNRMYTSGTTGFPKGTDLPPTMFAGGADMAEHVERLREGSFAGIGPHLIIGPMYHTGPLHGSRVLAAGTPLVILGRFDAAKTLEAIEKFKTVSAVMVPTHFTRLLALDEETRSGFDVSSMQLISHTGAKCPVDLKEIMISWWGPVFTDSYGATEVGTVCSINSQEWLAHKGSVGKANEPFEVVVVDEDDRELGPNEEGRLYFRDATGRGIVYPDDPQKSADAHRAPGEFTLGEIGYVDDDGFVYLTDRFSDMVVSGGVNLYPAEAEQVLLTHPAVDDVACIGVPHADLGEEMIALVVAAVDAAVDVAELNTYCRDWLSSFKCPRRFDVVATVERNAMGKINKRGLRDNYLAAQT